MIYHEDTLFPPDGQYVVRISGFPGRILAPWTMRLTVNAPAVSTGSCRIQLETIPPWCPHCRKDVMDTNGCPARDTNGVIMHPKAGHYS